MYELDRALSIHDAAKEAGDGAFLVDDAGALGFAACSREVLEREAPRSPVRFVASPSRASVLTILAALEARTPLVPIHPRWSPEEVAAVEEAVRRSARLRAHHLAVLFTSGSAGPRKGALLTRAAFLRAAEASAERLGYWTDDRWLLAMPLAHVGGLSIVIRALAARRAIVLGPEGPFEPRAVLASMRRHRVTIASLVPTQLARLVEGGHRPPEALRAVLLGGARCPDRVLERGIQLGWPLHVTYGLTEACAQVATTRAPLRSLEEAREEGAGEPLDGVEVRVRGDRVLVRSPALLEGWLDEALPSPLDAEGFYDTGDVGHLDARGRLHVTGRRGEQIVTGGEKVSPREVEEALLALPSVREACVVGIPDEAWGERVAAAIVSDEPLDERALAEALRGRLARYALPRSFTRLDALPTNSTGKLDRRAVRDRLASAQARGASTPSPGEEGRSARPSERK